MVIITTDRVKFFATFKSCKSSQSRSQDKHLGAVIIIIIIIIIVIK